MFAAGSFFVGSNLCCPAGRHGWDRSLYIRLRPLCGRRVCYFAGVVSLSRQKGECKNKWKLSSGMEGWLGCRRNYVCCLGLSAMCLAIYHRGKNSIYYLFVYHFCTDYVRYYRQGAEQGKLGGGHSCFGRALLPVHKGGFFPELW